MSEGLVLISILFLTATGMIGYLVKRLSDTQFELDVALEQVEMLRDELYKTNANLTTLRTELNQFERKGR